MTFRLTLTIGCLAFSSACSADDPVSPLQKSGATPAAVTADQPPQPKRPLNPIDSELLKTLEERSAPSEAAGSPLERVDQRMRDVQGRLAKFDSGDETQTIQREIVGDLESLIEQIKKGGNCPTCGAAQCNKHGKQKRSTANQQSGQQASKPNQANEPKEGQVTAGPGTVSDDQKAAGTRLVRAVWGHLPEKLREEMQQASQDTGLPKYRPLIELYFRSIAEHSESRRQTTP